MNGTDKNTIDFSNITMDLSRLEIAQYNVISKGITLSVNANEKILANVISHETLHAVLWERFGSEVSHKLDSVRADLAQVFVSIHLKEDVKNLDIADAKDANGFWPLGFIGEVLAFLRRKRETKE